MVLQLEYVFAARSLSGPLVLESVMVFKDSLPSVLIKAFTNTHPKDLTHLVTHLPVNSIVTFE